MAKELGKSIGTVATVLLLAVIFGLILQQLLTAESIANTTQTGIVTNETGAWINETAYTVSLSTEPSFGSLTLTALYNATDDSVIGLGNATVSGSGFTNATVTNWDDVIVSYTYTFSGANPNSAINLTHMGTTYSAFIVALVALFAVGGTIIAVLWLLPYIKPLVSKDSGLAMGA
jgi:hypothetical protein